MHQIKTCTLQLANLGKPMDPEYIISKVIRGLNSPHYRAIKEMVEARDTTISFDALHEKLINHDLCHPESTSLTNVPTTAFVATYRGPNNRHSTRPNTTSSLPRYNVQKSNASIREPTVCQYCNYKGHTFTNYQNFKKAHPHFVLTPYSRPRATLTTVPRPIRLLPLRHHPLHGSLTAGPRTTLQMTSLILLYIPHTMAWMMF
ncbi:hypothetical protein vseg_013448 [Gypsophila vaccaria]